MSARLIIGDVHEVLKTLPDNSVDLVLTSPPFLALRSYLPADHPDKAKELGSEPTPGAFIDALLDVVEECRRVLAPHGSLCIELGDTYAGSGGAGGDYGENGLREGQPKWRAPKPEWDSSLSPATAMSRNKNGAPGGRGWPQDKSLTLIPELFRISLAYGVNPLTGRTTEPWRIRNVIRWVRPNPPVGALGDKFRPATSEMVVATMSRTRYFDLDSVRGERSPNTHARTAKGVESRPRSGKSADRDGNWSSLPELAETAGAPPLDWWAIPTEPYPGSHYATWPRDLLVRPIKAMCPERVCRVCGEPSRRMVEATRRAPADDRQRKVKAESYRLNAHDHPPELGWEFDRATLGWTDCGHDSWRPGAVLDPFAGSGTTLAVATGHGRDAIGIDLDERNADLALQRVGMFLTVERHEEQVA